MLKLDFPLVLENFFRWWGTELLAFLPEKVRALLRRSSERLVALPSGDAVSLLLESTEGERAFGIFALDEEGRRLREETLAKEPLLQNPERVLRLRRGQALRKLITLPAATEENLRQVAGFEMNRYTPFHADQVFYDVRVIDRNSAANQITAELVFIPRKSLEALYEEMVAWGFQPVVVDHEEAVSAGARQRFNLLPEHLRPAAPKGPRILNTLLSALLFILAATSAALPLWFDYRLIDDLQERVGREGRLAKEVETIKEEADLLIGQTGALLDKKQQEPALVDMLNELTSLLPDNTWLTSFQYQDRRLQIQGQSPAASALIEIIEASPLFQNTSFVSPVTQDRASGLERFQISMQVTARGQDGKTE